MAPFNFIWGNDSDKDIVQIVFHGSRKTSFDHETEYIIKLHRSLEYCT